MTTNLATSAARIAAVRAVGTGDIRLSDTVAAIVAALPEGFDHKARAAVTTFVSEWINGAAEAPVQRTGGKGGPRTAYGIGFDSVVSSVKSALSVPPVKVESLTVTYVDADGAAHKVTIVKGDEMYAALAARTLDTAAE